MPRDMVHCHGNLVMRRPLTWGDAWAGWRRVTPQEVLTKLAEAARYEESFDLADRLEKVASEWGDDQNVEDGGAMWFKSRVERWEATIREVKEILWKGSRLAAWTDNVLLRKINEYYDETFVPESESVTLAAVVEEEVAA